MPPFPSLPTHPLKSVLGGKVLVRLGQSSFLLHTLCRLTLGALIIMWLSQDSYPDTLVPKPISSLFSHDIMVVCIPVLPWCVQCPCAFQILFPFRAAVVWYTTGYMCPLAKQLFLNGHSLYSFINNKANFSPCIHGSGHKGDILCSWIGGMPCA